VCGELLTTGFGKEFVVSILAVDDRQIVRLTEAVQHRVGLQRYQVWFSNSTRFELKHDTLEIAVPNDFIGEWISAHFSRPIQEAACEVIGHSLAVKFSVVPHLFDGKPDVARLGGASSQSTKQSNGKPALPQRDRYVGDGDRVVRPIDFTPADRKSRLAALGESNRTSAGNADNTRASTAPRLVTEVKPNATSRSTLQTTSQSSSPVAADYAGSFSPSSGTSASPRARLRHDLESFVVGASNQLTYNAALYVSEFPGAQYNPLFIHGNCGLGKTHMLQGLCKRFVQLHPTKKWLYLTGEEFTNEFLLALRNNRVDAFRRKLRDLDLLVIDDVHFLSGKKATQEEFLHTFNAIEAMGRQVVLASDEHPKLIGEFGESLINRFVSGMVVRVDAPNFVMRCELLRTMSLRNRINLSEEVIQWVAKRVTQNVRELEGAVTRISAHTRLTGRPADVLLAQEALGDLDRALIQPVKPDSVLSSVCVYFGLEMKELMSGRRQRTISLARSVAMYLVRKTSKLSFPEIAMKMGKRNHSTVISACRRIERASTKNERFAWSSHLGEREEPAGELIERLEEQARAMSN